MIPQKEMSEIRLKLREKIELFTREVFAEENHNLGYVGDELETYMTDAAFSVLLSCIDLNDYLNSQNLLDNNI